MAPKSVDMDVENRILDRIEGTMSQIASYLSSAKAFQRDDLKHAYEIAINVLSRSDGTYKASFIPEEGLLLVLKHPLLKGIMTTLDSMHMIMSERRNFRCRMSDMKIDPSTCKDVAWSFLASVVERYDDKAFHTFASIKRGPGPPSKAPEDVSGPYADFPGLGIQACRLIQLCHAAKCSNPCCLTPSCPKMKHVLTCHGDCFLDYCFATKCAVWHYNECGSAFCSLCITFRQALNANESTPLFAQALGANCNDGVPEEWKGQWSSKNRLMTRTLHDGHATSSGQARVWPTMPSFQQSEMDHTPSLRPKLPQNGRESSFASVFSTTTVDGPQVKTGQPMVTSLVTPDAPKKPPVPAEYRESVAPPPLEQERSSLSELERLSPFLYTKPIEVDWESIMDGAAEEPDGFASHGKGDKSPSRVFEATRPIKKRRFMLG